MEDRMSGLTVTLKIGPDYDRGTSRKMVKVVKVESFTEAAKAVRSFIEENDVGSGEWAGGAIRRHGHRIAEVTYGGKVKDTDGNDMGFSAPKVVTAKKVLGPCVCCAEPATHVDVEHGNLLCDYCGMPAAPISSITPTEAAVVKALGDTDGVVGLKARIIELETENANLKDLLAKAELAAIQPSVGHSKPRKSRDVTEDDVLKIVKGKDGGATVKELAGLLGLTYGQVYSVYHGYTFTGISKIKA